MVFAALVFGGLFYVAARVLFVRAVLMAVVSARGKALANLIGGAVLDILALGAAVATGCLIGAAWALETFQ